MPSISTTPQRARGGSPSKRQRAYDYLRARIEGGEFEPEARLLPGEIALELGFSIVPVREAIQRLTAEGIVTLEHNVGARLAAFDSRAYREGMESLAMLDGLAASLAAAHIDETGLAHARSINDELTALLESFDSKQYSALNAKFHETINTFCPNQRVLDLARTEWARFANLRDARHLICVSRAQESVREHTHILELIIAGADAAEIEHASRQHVLATLRWNAPSLS
ncbi:DNA-binding GntR family transcriptional regulator [Leucobacter exalbidus]|uniref:DNA-binding GntR family transcriptional regulator n=1 Tax=Leucobacter exalbidus TaxID=662960 RepID=A0A940T1W6_9MICO|nr:DNA-binding GntR family transcriptional regulator [Leucobacter exalbidus]